MLIEKLCKNLLYIETVTKHKIWEPLDFELASWKLLCDVQSWNARKYTRIKQVVGYAWKWE